MTEREPYEMNQASLQDSRADMIDSHDDVAPLPPKSYSPERNSLKLVMSRSEEQKSAI